jgi:NAD-reducing hydrogenase small subunit
MSKARLATIWLDGCSGCHMSLLDTDERLIELARRVEVVYGPLVDAQEFPRNVDVTVVEGAVSSQEDLEKIRLVRQRTKFLVALGDCAVTSNVPAMRNGLPVRALLERVYAAGGAGGGKVPADGVPPLLRHAMPLHRVVKVDLHVPGCPPKADAIFLVLSQLLEGRTPELAGAVRFG